MIGKELSRELLVAERDAKTDASLHIPVLCDLGTAAMVRISAIKLKHAELVETNHTSLGSIQ